jgi:hypothetical protein
MFFRKGSEGLLASHRGKKVPIQRTNQSWPYVCTCYIYIYIYIGNWEADLLHGSRCRLELVFIIARHPGVLFGHSEGRLTEVIASYLERG